MTHALSERKIRSSGIILQCYWGGVDASVLAPCSLSTELICGDVFCVRPLTGVQVLSVFRMCVLISVTYSVCPVDLFPNQALLPASPWTP